MPWRWLVGWLVVTLVPCFGFGCNQELPPPRSCCICGTVLVDAVTLVPCGHSVCKRCVTRDKSCRSVYIKQRNRFDQTTWYRKCGAEIKYSSSEDGRAGLLKPSILISQIVDKLWANEKRAVQLRYEGNKLFQVRALSHLRGIKWRWIHRSIHNIVAT